MKCCRVFQTTWIVTNMFLLQKLCKFFWEKNESKAMFCAINLKVLLKATSANSFIILAHPNSWYCNMGSFFSRFWFLILLGVKYGFSGLNLFGTWLEQSSQLCLLICSFSPVPSLCVLGAPHGNSIRFSLCFTLSGDNSCVCLVSLGHCCVWVSAETHKWE